ncbi:MAG: hypothetical protein HQ580_17435 [Planctomycetes bacterium]|nr:hypothetical protein [Planctomycetota bacterium]
MKKEILLAAVILLSTVCFTQAQDELSGTIDVTYLSAYTWYGIDMYPGAHGEGATQTSLDLDLYGTGLGLGVKWVRANSAAVDAHGGGISFENGEELWLTLSYSNSCFEYETYATDYSIGWVNYDYPDEPSNIKDAQEMFVTFSWPEICPEGVVPSYTLVRMWASESSALANDLSGWVHIAGLGYDLSVEDILPDLPEQILHLSAAFVWNEGAGAAGVDHDFSHLILGVSTDFDLGNDLTLTPGVYHQNTPEKSVNPDEDLTWASLSLKYAF